MPTDYVYLCSSCSDCIIAFPEEEHDREFSPPCPSCDERFDLIHQTADTRARGDWTLTDYGPVSEGFVIEPARPARGDE